MEKFIFEKLEVYKKALEFIGKVIDTAKTLPTDIKYTLGKELIKTSVSIANNLAEGSGRRSRKEKRQFYDIAQGSIFECIPMLSVLKNKTFITQEEYSELYEYCFVMAKMVSGLIRHQTTNL
ncbi:MAG: four helix bundle protein [Candidatus Omnitrophota bacterium]